jgi:hypothetical protein
VTTQDHPIQPQYLDENLTLRFKKNRIVEWLAVQCSNLSAVSIWCQTNGIPREDYDQLAQLIGLSVSGAPISDACRARIPEFDAAVTKEPTFEQGFKLGYAQAKRDAADAIDELEMR